MRAHGTSRVPRCKGIQKRYCPSCKLENCGKCKHCLTPSSHQGCMNKPKEKCITFIRYMKPAPSQSKADMTSLTATKSPFSAISISKTKHKVVKSSAKGSTAYAKSPTTSSFVKDIVISKASPIKTSLISSPVSQGKYVPSATNLPTTNPLVDTTSLSSTTTLPSLSISNAKRNILKSAMKGATPYAATPNTLSFAKDIVISKASPIQTSLISSPISQGKPIPTTALVATAKVTLSPQRRLAVCGKTFSTTVATSPITATSEVLANRGTINISQAQKELQNILSSLSATLNKTLSSIDFLSSRLQSMSNESAEYPIHVPVTPSTGFVFKKPTGTMPLSVAPISTSPMITTSSNTAPKILATYDIIPPASHSVVRPTLPTTSQGTATLPVTTGITSHPASHSIMIQALPTPTATNTMASPEARDVSFPAGPIPIVRQLSQPLAIASTSKISLKGIMKEAISNIRIDLHITKCGISGPPGTGKTHFRKLLLGKKRPAKRKSTALSTRADELTPGDVAIAPTSPQLTNTLKWTVLGEEPWLRLLTNTVFEYLKKNQNIEDLNDEYEDISGDRFDFSNEVYLFLLKTLRETKGRRRVRRRTLHKINLIYLVDTGGQPQFQEILPHFVQSSVHFLVHNLSQKLSDCPDFQYTVDEVEYRVPETLKASNISIIEQSVRSACSCIKDTWNKGHPQVAIIGTFKDQCHPAEINRILQDKSKEIKTTLMPYTECKPAMKCDIMGYSKDRAIYPIDASEKGWDSNGPILEKIRSEINVLGKTINLKKIPMSYFIFLQNLKHVSTKRPYISISECKKIASEGFIALSDEEIKEALHLFNEVTLILHFPGTPEVKNLIFLDPTFLYDKITKLIVKSFVCLQSRVAQMTEFHRTGVFKKDNAFSICDHQFTIDMFLSILKDLYIISETEYGSYFMPCVLQLEDPNSLSSNCHRQLETIKNDMNINNIGGPLLISFGDRISPRGLFCAIVVILSNHFGWKLNSDDNSILRRNIIEFRVMHATKNSIGLSLPACVGKAVIFDKTTHLEVYTTCPETYCSEVRCAIVWSLSEACKTLKYQIGNLGVKQGFRCELCLDRGQHHTVVSKNTKKLLVHKCSKNLDMRGVPLSLHKRIWFQGHTQDSSSTEVAIPDISVIANILLPKTNAWYMIGLILHIHINDLEKIRIDNQNEEERFLKVLDKWKKNKDPSFTWNTIRDVLKSDLVKENVLAQEIEDTYLNNS